MLRLNVKTQYNAAAKQFSQLGRRLPSLTAQALNKTSTEARRRALAAASRELKLPQSVINKQWKRGGGAERRVAVTGRATPWRLQARVSAHLTPLPFFAIAGAQTRAGVRGKGGRLERGAFKVPKGSKTGLVFRRTGKPRLPVEMPKIALRGVLQKHMDSFISGPEGLATFRKFYRERINAALARAGVKA